LNNGYLFYLLVLDLPTFRVNGKDLHVIFPSFVVYVVVLNIYFFLRRWDFNNGGFLPGPPRENEVKRLLFDSTRKVYKEFRTENPDCPISLTSFQRIKKRLNCIRAKGEVDACCICCSEFKDKSKIQKFVYSQHVQLVRKAVRAIRTIIDLLLKGFYKHYQFICIYRWVQNYF
jgi:hypothetical protein